MRILFITATYLPTINGVTHHISSTAEAMRKLGHEVYIFAPSFPGYQDKDKYVIRYPSFPNPLIKNYPVGIPFVSIKKIKKLDIDIVHTHHPSIIGQVAFQIAEKLEKPLFFTAHTQYEQYLNYYFPHGYDFTSKILINDLKKISRCSKKVICPSINTQIRLNKHGIENTIVINNGIEENFFVNPSNKPLTIPTLVYTGRIDREKNPFELLKIAVKLKRMIPNFRFIILGSGLLHQKMIDMALKLKLDKNVIFTGNVEREVIPEIYKSAHLFLTTSVSEVMPISILEAMASGLPTIALEKSGLEEIVIEGKTGYLCINNPRKIAEKINEIISNPKNYANLSSSTYEYSKNFTAQKTAEKLCALYTS
jgi:1,2-diacylglycerol 3-alpha-glucosyltransferase